MAKIDYRRLAAAAAGRPFELMVSVAAGAGSDSNIPIAYNGVGIEFNDGLVSVIEFTSGVPSDVTADFAITSTGNIQGSVSTSGNHLVVTWYKNHGNK